MNKPSDNLLAGALFRAIAAHDEDKKSEPLTIGQRVYKESTTEWMTSLKVPVLASEINLYDGAGLSAESNTTARAFIEVLKHLAAQPYFATIWDSLPIGGVDGTISSRYKNPAVRGKVRAKTGTMGGHYQLAGYIPRTGADGKSVKELIPFVILTTTPPTKAYQAAARAYQEGIVLNLARQINGK